MNSAPTDSVRHPRLARQTKLFELALVVFWFFVDQATKGWVLANLLDPLRTLRVAPFFDLALGWNRGISFGMLAGHELPPWVLACMSATIAAVLLVWLFRTDNRLTGTGLALMIGGALGNALDRLRYGAVTDFLDFHVGDWHWPAFNMGDVGVVCGAALLILDSFVLRERDAT